MRIGIDLGGTRVRAGLLTDEGELIRWQEHASEVGEGPEHTVGLISMMVRELMQGHEVKSIGIGAPGPLDAKAGVILETPNLPEWKNVPLVQMLHGEFSLPVRLDNDANVAALAEAVKGNGAAYDSVWYTTVSTGIGSGYVLNRKVVTGKNSAAGEIGNMILVPDGRKSGLLNAGALEAYASGTAMGQLAKERLNIEGGAKELLQRAINGDGPAIGLIDECMDYLASAMANVVHTVDPDVLIFGGGVMTHHDFLLPLLKHKMKSRVYPSLAETLVLQPALLQEEAGMIGAAMLYDHEGKEGFS